LFKNWWDKIETSKKITKNQHVLESYRNNLHLDDLTLLGCITDGGVGLQTGNNGKYVAARRTTKSARNIVESRPQKLAEAIKKHHIVIPQMAGFLNEKDFLNSLTEKEIASLFDELKEKYGRDIFSQGYMYRIIEEDEIADVEKLTDDEKANGIDATKPYYVPYDKGDKDGNRWYLDTPFAIAWTKENVKFLKRDPKARYQGYTYFFREGFCWSDINTTYLKCRQKQKSINDVKSMSLFGTTECVPEYYIISLINSTLFSLYVDNFVNNTQTFQINDARQLPIIVPNEKQLEECKRIFDESIKLKKEQLNTTDTNRINVIEHELSIWQEKLDTFVLKLYGLDEK